MALGVLNRLVSEDKSSELSFILFSAEEVLWRRSQRSNEVPKLLQGHLRKPGQQLDGADPGVHHGKLEEEDKTYLKVEKVK